MQWWTVSICLISSIHNFPPAMSLLSPQGSGLPGLAVSSLCGRTHYVLITSCSEILKSFSGVHIVLSCSLCLCLGHSRANRSSWWNWTNWTKGRTLPVYNTVFILYINRHKQIISCQNPFISSFLFPASFIPPLRLGCHGTTWTSRTSRTSWQASKCLLRTGFPGTGHLVYSFLMEQKWS